MQSRWILEDVYTGLVDSLKCRKTLIMAAVFRSKNGNSGSSEDLADCIGSLSPDDLSSDNSPVHQMKTHKVSSDASKEKWEELGNRLSKSTLVLVPALN